MSAGLEQLTAKEKEALRLLLSGHDAKSSASELGISVHTVNDRLRNARRKLSVSSSREAARILGDAESNTPNSSVHQSIGISSNTVSSDNAGITNAQHGGLNKPLWFAGGMLIMSVAIAAAIVFAIQGTSSTFEANTFVAENEGEGAMAQSPDSLPRAEYFLTFVDANDWEGSWKAAGAYFQSQASAEEWAKIVKPVRSPLGKVNARRLSSVQRASTLPGAPEGDYEILQFQTDFAAPTELSVETLVMLEGEQGWEVVGYFVR